MGREIERDRKREIERYREGEIESKVELNSTENINSLLRHEVTTKLKTTDQILRICVHSGTENVFLFSLSFFLKSK